MADNPNCDGSHCTRSTGPVKLYPQGGGGNSILCRTCWEFENAYRRRRAEETGEPQNWPEVDWCAAKAYPTD